MEVGLFFVFLFSSFLAVFKVNYGQALVVGQGEGREDGGGTLLFVRADDVILSNGGTSCDWASATDRHI